ncbi:MAG: endonuclease III [Planctomycetes bacterium]|nr:endonuclease III [Planctomycetota bacterium]
MPTALPRKSPRQLARARRLLAALKRRYPDAHCELDWREPHELLVATILSAQSTDVGVNRATPGLFKAFPRPSDYAAAGAAAIEPHVRTLNFWRNKARSVHESMQALCDRFEGQVPRTMEELLTLRGVARKTANVVLGNAFGLQEGVVVDTHVGRLARRMGLSRHEDPAKVERDLMALFPRKDWCLLSHLLIFHGRRACRARGGRCAEDPICLAFCAEARLSSRGPAAPRRRRAPARPRPSRRTG